MQTSFHPLEIKWNFVLWLILFCELYSTKQYKSKNAKLISSSTKTQHADAAVSNCETMCMEVSKLCIIQRVTKQWYFIAWIMDM
jgi:hypothetical protein